MGTNEIIANMDENSAWVVAMEKMSIAIEATKRAQNESEYLADATAEENASWASARSGRLDYARDSEAEAREYAVKVARLKSRRERAKKTAEKSEGIAKDAVKAWVVAAAYADVRREREDNA